MYSKGADSHMFPLLKTKYNFPCSLNSDSSYMDKRFYDFFCSTSKNLKGFASVGLRTLICASKTLEEKEYLEWHELYKKSQLTLNDRQKHIDDGLFFFFTFICLIFTSVFC
jgi:magnesium-transporting ATPase (P-type)